MGAYIRKRSLTLSQILPGYNINSRIYINEHITAITSKLLHRCAELKRKKTIAMYYTRNGFVFIKHNLGDKATRANVADISELETNCNNNSTPPKTCAGRQN